MPCLVELLWGMMKPVGHNRKNKSIHRSVTPRRVERINRTAAGCKRHAESASTRVSQSSALLGKLV